MESVPDYKHPDLNTDIPKAILCRFTPPRRPVKMPSVHSVQKHNEMELARLEIGDAVVFKRATCSHWGLYIGDGLVIHLTGESSAECCFSLVTNSGLKYCIRVDGFFDVANDAKACKNNCNDSRFRVRPIDEILDTCWSMDGKRIDNFLWKNCEHFVNCCKYGEETSRQITPIQQHNELELAGLMIGDVVEFKRGIYSHWALFIGDGLVIHLTRDNSAIDCNCSGVSISGQTSEKALVRVDGFFDFANDDKAIKNNYDDSKFRVRPVEEIIAYTMSLGSLECRWNNCEQFVHFCRYDVNESQQITPIQQHNKLELAGLKKGDVVEFKRGIYSHWALFIGNGLVIHLTRDNSAIAYDCSGVSISGQTSEKALVRVGGFFDVANDDKAIKNNYDDSVFRVRPVEEIIAYAMSMRSLEDRWNNCEQFVHFCRYDVNESQQYNSWKIGDAIEFTRGIYSHWALYIGDGQVIHVTLDSSSGCMNSEKAWVKIARIPDSGLFVPRVNNYYDGRLRVRPVDEIIATALSMKGEINYDVLTKNCEHFVNYCRYGEERCSQVEDSVIIAVYTTTANGAMPSSLSK